MNELLIYWLAVFSVQNSAFQKGRICICSVVSGSLASHRASWYAGTNNPGLEETELKQTTGVQGGTHL